MHELLSSYWLFIVISIVFISAMMALAAYTVHIFKRDGAVDEQKALERLLEQHRQSYKNAGEVEKGTHESREGRGDS